MAELFVSLQIVTVQGQGFSVDIDRTQVWLGGKECYVRSISESEIICRARGGGTFGNLPIVVLTGGEYATGNVAVFGVLHISSISQAYGSTAGGSILEIEGNGFADDSGIITTNSVSIGVPPAAPCRVLSASRTRLVCQTEPAGRMHPGAFEGYLSPLEVSVSGIYAQCRVPSLCAPGCDSSSTAAPGTGVYGSPNGGYGATDGRYGHATAGEYGNYGGRGTYAGTGPQGGSGAYGAGSYGGYGAYGAYGSTSSTQKCCPFSVPDPNSVVPIAFIGDDQEYGTDNCAFYYTNHATPMITAMSLHVLAHDVLHIEGSMLNRTGVAVYFIPMAEDELDRWMNPYSQEADPPEADPPEAVKLPDMWSPDGRDHLMLQLEVHADSDILAIVPGDIESGTYLPVVWSEDTGAAEYMLSNNGSSTSALPLVQVHPRIDGVEPPSLTSSGGMITVMGGGFPSQADRVRVEGKGGRWVVIEASSTMITAYTPRWLYADGPNLSVSVKGVTGEKAECESAQETCIYYAEAPMWNTIIESRARVAGVFQEAPGAAVMISIERTSSTMKASTAVLANQTVLVMFGANILSSEIDTVEGNITIPLKTVAELPASPPAGHAVVILIDGMAAAGEEPVIHAPLNIASISAGMGVPPYADDISMCLRSSVSSSKG